MTYRYQVHFHLSMVPSISRIIHTVCESIVCLYLFTHSDIKTIFIPVTAFATLARPTVEPRQFIHTLVWVWLHLLQFCVSNQSVCPEEDVINKPWRPIPSGKITQQVARRLRWLLLPICLAVSSYFNVQGAGIILSLGIWAYNELDFHTHWLTRNICNALGYAAFDRGATFVDCQDKTCSASPPVFIAQTITALIILTTIHAQDFQDAEGDRRFNRRTIPIVMPVAGRVTMPLLLCCWSFLLIARWTPTIASATVLLLTAALTGLRFAIFKTPTEDRRSYILYNVWLCLAQIILLKTDSEVTLQWA